MVTCHFNSLHGLYKNPFFVDSFTRYIHVNSCDPGVSILNTSQSDAQINQM